MTTNLFFGDGNHSLIQNIFLSARKLFMELLNVGHKVNHTQKMNKLNKKKNLKMLNYFTVILKNVTVVTGGFLLAQ